MLRKLTAFTTTLLVFTLVAGCKKSGSSSQTATAKSPTETARAFYDAAKAKDVQTLKSLMTPKSLEIMEAFAKMGNQTLDESLKDTSKMPPAFEARNEKVMGDTATVEVKSQGGKWDTLYLVKEGGQWKLALDKAMENSKPDAGPTTDPDLPPPSTGKGEGEQPPSDDEHSTH